MIGKSNNFKNQNNMKNFNSNSVNESNNLSTISTADEMKKVSGSCTLNMSTWKIQPTDEEIRDMFVKVADFYFDLKDFCIKHGVSNIDWFESKEYESIDWIRDVFYNLDIKNNK